VKASDRRFTLEGNDLADACDIGAVIEPVARSDIWTALAFMAATFARPSRPGKPDNCTQPETRRY